LEVENKFYRDFRTNN